MERVIYNRGNGLGVILDAFEDESEFFAPLEFNVNNEIIKAGDETTLSGYFVSPIRYVGSFKDEPKCMVFYLGSEGNLFQNMKYYACLYWLTPYRIVNKFSFNSARDFNFINGKWE